MIDPKLNYETRPNTLATAIDRCLEKCDRPHGDEQVEALTEMWQAWIDEAVGKTFDKCIATCGAFGDAYPDKRAVADELARWLTSNKMKARP